VTREALHLVADGNAIGLLARDRALALEVGLALALALGNRLTHCLGGGFERVGQRRVDLDVGLELGPCEPDFGKACRRLTWIGHSDQRLGLPPQVIGTLPIGRRHGRSVRSGLLRLLCGAQPHSRAARRHLVAPALGHGLQRLGRGEPFERSDGDIGVLRLGRNRGDLIDVAQALQRTKAGTAVRCVPADRSQQLRVLQRFDRGCTHRKRRRSLGDGADLPGTPELGKLPQCCLADTGVRCFHRESGQTANRFGTHVVIRVGASDFAEHRGLVDARHCRAAYARVGVLAC
jgi:hypothetical protein